MDINKDIDFKKRYRRLAFFIIVCVLSTYFIISNLIEKINYLERNIVAGVGGSGWAFYCEVENIEFDGAEVRYNLIKTPRTEKAIELINRHGYDVTFDKIKDERYRLNVIDKFTKEIPLAKEIGMNDYIRRLTMREKIEFYGK